MLFFFIKKIFYKKRRNIYNKGLVIKFISRSKSPFHSHNNKSYLKKIPLIISNNDKQTKNIYIKILIDINYNLNIILLIK
jgi:hypothetical protein